MERIRFSEKEGSLFLQVRVQPRSSRSRICGEYDGGLKVALKAAPVDDAANRECCALLAKVFGVPPSMVHIAAGATSRNKTVRIEGVRTAHAEMVLKQQLGPG